MGKKEHKKRPDGRVQEQITITNEITGEKIVKTVYGYSEHELQIAKANAVQKYGVIINSDFTLYTYLTAYIAQRRADLAGLDGRNTLDTYEAHIDNYVKDTTLGNTPLTSLTVFLLHEFFTDFVPKNKTTSGKRIKQLVYTILKMALTQAVYDGYIESNPLDRIRRPQYKSGKKGVLTDEQVTNILKLVREDNPQIANMFSLDVILGLRRSEILALKFTDIDFKEKTLKIDKGIKRIKGKGSVLGSTKTREMVRMLPLDKFSKYLRQQLKLAKGNPVKNGRIFRMDSFVFSDKNGHPFKPDYATKISQQYRDELNLPKRTSRYTHLGTRRQLISLNMV